MTSRIGFGWPDSLDEILVGDHAVMLAYVTPARGVVLAPVTNFGLHDREAGVVMINSSVGAWKKLDRIRRNPHVALAFHTRAHAKHGRPEYVLVQGTAALGPPVEDYPSTILETWDQVEPWRNRAWWWKRWQRIYALRVDIRVAIERIVVWPDLSCSGAPAVYGKPLPEEAPAAQRAPARGTGPRLNHRRAARGAARQPDVLLGWVGADGFPVALAVGVAGADERGVLLDAPPGLVPPGGRRAGLTAHWFSRGVVGQRQIICTGWIDPPAAADRLSYAPHTRAAYWMPPSRLVYRIAVGGATRLRYGQARKAGAAIELPRAAPASAKPEKFLRSHRRAL